MLPDTLAIGWYKPLFRHGKITMNRRLHASDRGCGDGGGVVRVGPAVGIALLTAAPCFAQSGAVRQAPPQAFIAEHCIECHNSTDQTAAALYAGLFFDKVDVMHVADNPETWEKVVRKLGAGMLSLIHI